MDFPLNAEVQCSDGVYGHSTYLVLNPVNRQVTHVVVRPDGFLDNVERLVDVEYIADTTAHQIQLKCTKQKVSKMKDFTELMLLPHADMPHVMLWPYVTPMEPLIIEHQAIPPGELAVERGYRVEATDGSVGRVDEFLVDPKTWYITHLVMREGHLWGQRDVTIPVSQIARIDDDVVYLNLDKHSVEALPTIPLRR